MAGIIITAGLVAVDALIIGSLLKFKQVVLTALVLGSVSFISFFLCNMFPIAIVKSAVTGYVVGLVFVLLGLCRLCFSKEKRSAPVSVLGFIVLWATMSVDIILSVFGLSMDGNGNWLVPTAVAVAHAAALLLGCFVGGESGKKEYVASAALIIIGIVKFFGGL